MSSVVQQRRQGQTARSGPDKGRGLTLLRTYLAIGMALPFLHGLASKIGPNDYWWHIAYGRDIAATGAIPQVDTYSFTRLGEPFFDQGWLAQLGMYGVESAGGVRLAVLVLALILALTYGLILREAYLRTRSIKLSVIVVTLFTGLLSATNWSVRPQTLAFFLFTILFLRVEKFRRGQLSIAGLWPLPVVMVLWVNVHGSFVVGISYMTIVAVGQLIERRRSLDGALTRARWRGLVAVGLLATAALIVNPRGPMVLQYVRGLVGDSGVRQLVTEWQPPTLGTPAGLLFLAGVLAVFLAVAYSPRRLPLTDLLLLATFLLLGLTAVRNAVWFAIVVTPMMAEQIAAVAPMQRPDERGWVWGNRALVAVLVLLAVVAWPWNRPLVGSGAFGGVVTAGTPLKSTAVLEAGPRPSRLFNELGFGAYLMYEVPDQRLFIDPRIELYPYEQLQDYMILSAGYDVPRLLTKYEIDGALLSKENQAGLIDHLRGDDGWDIVHEDDAAILMYRDS